MSYWTASCGSRAPFPQRCPVTLGDRALVTVPTGSPAEGHLLLKTHLVNYNFTTN